MIEQLPTIVKENLVEIANECVAEGMKLKGVRFTYNVQGRCTQALLSYEEQDPQDYIEPLQMEEL